MRRLPKWITYTDLLVEFDQIKKLQKALRIAWKVLDCGCNFSLCPHQEAMNKIEKLGKNNVPNQQ